jgi:hypothetical protein
MNLLDSWLLRIVLYFVVGILVWVVFKTKSVSFNDFFVGYTSISIRWWMAGIIIVPLFLVSHNFINLNGREHFGFSNGTIIQLQTSHVPTVEEVEEGGRQYRKQVEHDLEAMTY